MRVLLISANTEKINIIPIPLGLIDVARAAQHAGHDVQILDLMTHVDFRKSVKESVRTFCPEVIAYRSET